MQDILPDQTDTDWAPGPVRPSLPAGELHLWRTRLPDAPECPVERSRARRLQAQSFRREITARYAGLAGWSDNCQYPSEIPGLRISHAECDGIALLAVTRGVRDVGLDVERVREDIPFDDMAAKFLDARAQWDLRVTWSRHEKAWKFFQFWTSNEACSQVQTASSQAETRIFQLRKFFPNEDFIAALAINGGPSPALQFWDWLN